MGLYLCVFDDAGKELDGVEVGSYADFNFFRDTIIATVEKGKAGTVCPILINHSDSDGEWTPQDAHYLIVELEQITKAMRLYPPIEFNSEWKKQVAKTCGVNPLTLLDCFFDIDGEPLVERIGQLAHVSVSCGSPILFQ